MVVGHSSACQEDFVVEAGLAAYPSEIAVDSEPCAEVDFPKALVLALADPAVADQVMEMLAFDAGGGEMVAEVAEVAEVVAAVVAETCSAPSDLACYSDSSSFAVALEHELVPAFVAELDSELAPALVHLWIVVGPPGSARALQSVVASCPESLACIGPAIGQLCLGL